jgi:hypothetical protein
MRFCPWNVRSLQRTEALKKAVREMGKYNLEGVQEDRWEKNGTERAENYTSIYGERNGDYQAATGFFLHNRIVSVVRIVVFISDRMSYIILRDPGAILLF